ncbi:MAG: diacylglycerol kinase family lipid kinase [Prevotellaceae bacterium]|nr:diacylglycerol kinase family lipid kinase [Prevotellaceae bacterium]
MAATNIAFILNPVSGAKQKRNFPLLIRRFFTYDKGFRATFYRTRAAGDATAMAKKFAAEDYDIVVAIGGDGTVNEVAQALVNTSTALGIVPVGSGNGLARHLHIPMSPCKALARIATAKVRWADYGLMNGIPFFCTAGVGFDALIGNKFAQAGYRGLATYMQQILREFVSYKPEEYNLTVDGKTMRRKAFLITFANASQWGNNACIAPAASVSDGLLDVVALSEFPLYCTPNIGLRLFTRQIDRCRYIEIFRCRSAAVDRAHSGYVHYDGEPSQTGKHVEVKLVQGALKIVGERCEA